MSEWLAGLMVILGALWAIPAWYFGKAAGMRAVKRPLYLDWSSVEEYEEQA